MWNLYFLICPIKCHHQNVINILNFAATDIICLPIYCEQHKVVEGLFLVYLITYLILRHFSVVSSFFYFPGLSGAKFHFDSHGDGPARYNIIHFKQVNPGNYQWVLVGEYVEGELRLNMDGKLKP